MSPLTSTPGETAEALVTGDAPTPAHGGAAAPSDWRASLAGASGRRYWKSLEALADNPEFHQFLNENVTNAPTAPLGDPVTRRTFLTVMGAALAMAGASGCIFRQPKEALVAHNVAPSNLPPGQRKFYATAFSRHGQSVGVLVESRDGRPTHIEGNPEHPASRGSVDSQTIAEILNLYDPDRSTGVRSGNKPSTWDAFDAFAAGHFAGLETRSSQLAFVSEPSTSPTLARVRAALKAKYPSAKWVEADTFSNANVRAGIKSATGHDLDPVYRLENAAVVVSLDGDLFAGVDGTRHQRGFAARRRVVKPGDTMSRLYAAEPGWTGFGMVADNRLRSQAGRMRALLAGVAVKLGTASNDDTLRALARRAGEPGLTEREAKWADAVAKDLAANRGASLIVAGDRQPAAVHTFVHLLNAALGNAGKTVEYTAPLRLPSDGTLADVVAGIRNNSITTVVIVGGNPVYTADPALSFGGALATDGLTSIHLSESVNETSVAAKWHLNRAHPLEAWGDTRATGGAASIVQPLIAPLYGGRSDIEALSRLAGDKRDGYAIVRETWFSGSFGEQKWRVALNLGVVAGSDAPTVVPTPKYDALEALPAPAGEGFEILIAPSNSLGDGRYNNIAWLQELPDPVTKITWDNAAVISRTTARTLGVKNGDFVNVATAAGASVKIPAWIVPGTADNTVHLAAGHGAVGDGAGQVAKAGGGVDVYPLRGGGDIQRGQVSRTPGKAALACTQDHHTMAGRAIVREATLDEFSKLSPGDKDHFRHEVHVPTAPGGADLTLWPGYEYKGHKWGMAIDLSTCTGCNACVTACQSENNIPSIGREEVAKGREMHWLRIDRYFVDFLDPKHDPDQKYDRDEADIDEDVVDVAQQPMTCQQCENAPCETVCPVGATTHSTEGLNDMAYNRCIGTRYCSNNCPYKVRRFNWFNFYLPKEDPRTLAHNPDVTVRMRGIMEKCSYCVQRIQRARIDARASGSDNIPTDSFKTACQAACATGAITFGDLNDAASGVSQQRASNRAYEVLAELNIRPRTSYLARIRNPHPDLAPARDKSHAGHGE